MSIRVDGTYDVECAGWDRFLVGEILDADGSRFVSWDEDDFYSELRSRDGHYWAHSGGRYDALWALDRAFLAGDEPKMSPRGAGLLTLRIGGVTLCDSAAIWPDRLSTVARIAGREKLELSLPCKCGKGCGGYCALERKLTARERTLVETYLHADCEVLLEALSEMQERAEEYGLDLRSTVGATAWRTAKAWLDLPDCTHELATYRQIREGTYGGRVECGVPLWSGTLYRNDRNASYPAALSQLALPVGTPVIHESPRAARAAWNKGRHGVYGCRVFVPEQSYPPLPARTVDRLLYPTGPIVGAWTRIELEYAVAECGVRIDEIFSAVTWPRTEKVLAPFAERIWSLRDENATSGDARDAACAKWLKWIANSATGKFSQKPESDVYEYVKGRECDDGDPVIRSTPHGYLLAWEKVRVSSCAHVEWGGYLLASARIEEHRQMRHAEDVGRFVYGDTDSVYSTHALSRNMGNGLGQWKLEGTATRWCALAPKLYRFRCDGCKDHPQGDWHVRGKGMSGLDADGFELLSTPDPENPSQSLPWEVDRGVRGLRDALRSDGPVFQRKKMLRRVHRIEGWIGGRELLTDGTTRAPTMERWHEAFG